MKQRLRAWGDTKVINIASCLIYNEDGLLLLLQRHSDDLGGGQWGFPGGRVEGQEEAEVCVLREVYEETALRLPPVQKLGEHEIRMPHGTVHMTSFKATVSNDVVITLDPEEHHAYAWFNSEGLLNEDNILWGTPTILHDFGLFADFAVDPTLSDGSRVMLLSRA